jgi:UDP-2,3-diacylglucosamine hydrolase
LVAGALSGTLPAMNPSEKPTYFFADAHLTSRRTPSEREREARLDRFLAHVRDHAGRLYIVGDLFDFWFSYRHAIPAGHIWLYRRLLEFRESGIPVTFLAGNHDYWCLDFLRDEFGIESHEGSLDATIQGRRIWLAHGDGLIGSDWGYRRLKSILRNRLAITAYRLIHPDFGIPLAHSSSDTSRHHTESRDPVDRAYLAEVARPRFAEGFDAVVMGHIHIPTHIEEDDKHMFFLGDWISEFTYLVLENGAFEPRRWQH